MTGTVGDNSISRRISPTEALKLVLSADPNRSIHDAAEYLTEWARRNKCRLWCNDNLLNPRYIKTSLVVVAQVEVDGRAWADVVSSVREAWKPQVYNFELDEDEVRRRAKELPPAQLPAQPPAQPSPKRPPKKPADTDTKVEEFITLETWMHKAVKLWPPPSEENRRHGWRTEYAEFTLLPQASRDRRLKERPTLGALLNILTGLFPKS